MNNINQYASQLGQQPLATAATYQAGMMEMSTTLPTSESQPLYTYYTTDNNNNNSTLLSQSLMAAQQMMMSAQSITDEQQPTQQYSTAALQYPTIADQQQQLHIPTTTAPTSAVSSLSGGGVSPTYNNNSSMVAAATATTKRIPLPSSTSQSMPTSIFLLKNPLRQGSSNASDEGEDDTPPTHPVPEFLCHLYTMVNDQSLDHLISWEVPTQDQSKYEGGGMKGVGKVVIHDPLALQDILGRYYRHSSYPSFQRQLNYFGFKKRLTTKKKGKMSPCSFVHESLGKRPSSMLKLKRRQATKKERNTGRSATIVSTSTSGTSSTTMSTNKLSKKRSTPLIMISPRPRTMPATVPLNDCAFNTGSLINLSEATNDTIVEARKMLEQNFLKEFSLVKEHVPLLQPQDQQLYQQQMAAVLPFQEQPQAMTAQQQQLQQQQNEQMLTLLSNHSSAFAMSDNGELLNHSLTQTNQSKPSWLSTDTLYNPSFINVPQVQGNFQTQAAAHTVSTNYLMGEVNMAADNMTNNPLATTTANNTTEESNTQGGGVINPDLQQELDTLLNNLLSTALPRANELFNDDTLSDDVSCDLIDEPLQQQEPLQVSDDGCTLSTS